MSFLPAVAIGLQAAAPIVGGVLEAKGLRREARALEEGARRDESQGAADAVADYRESRLALGEDMAALAGSGFAIGSGSAQDMLTQALVERELSAMNIRHSALLQANEKRAAATDRRKAAKTAVYMGILNGATAAVGGAVQSRSDARAAQRNETARTSARAGYGLGG